ncbi:disintegrin and metalloproteinase domain-containing protein 20 [Pogona vitticeps]
MSFRGFLPLYGKITSTLAWLLMMFLRNILMETAGQMPPQGFRYAFYEVTIPRKLAPKYGREHQDITYSLQIGGKGYILYLKQRTGLIPKHFPIFTYSKEGDLQVDYPFIRDDCFYRGFVQGNPHSLVTLSTCSGGLRGLLQLANEIYEIEPVQASATFQHVVYRLEEKGDAVRMRCGLTEEEQKRQEFMMQITENAVTKSDSGRVWWTHTRYVKVAIVVDHERFVKFDRNETLISMQVLEVVHTANSLYDPLPVQLSVAGLEIWSAKNLIQISDTINDTLLSFTLWRRDSLVKRLQHDAGHLFLYKSFGTTLGLAYMGTICDNQWGSAVESYMTSSLFHFSNTFAHELGHILGMKHDDKYCSCNRNACIMAAVQATTDKFSDCSYNDYFRLRDSSCLFIPPDSDKMYKLKNCGNKVVDNGEQCDCGSKAECESDLCCQSNCMFRSGATCAFGQCCAKCQYLPAQTVCRDNTSICDLPEYCTGTSVWCPEDVYVQDGAPCNDGAHCYHGKCTTHQEQCKLIFGTQATVASEDCFREMNTQGDRFGNCGFKNGTYNKCHAANILCGRIQCDNVDNLPSLEEHSTIIQSHIGNGLCWSIDYNNRMEATDIGAVRDGSSCGPDMMCIDSECVNISHLMYDCDVKRCHHRGICNTHKHCHCDYGWAPPDCLYKGYGGSIDSGPPPPQKRSLSFSTIGLIVRLIYILAVAVIWFGMFVHIVRMG